MLLVFHNGISRFGLHYYSLDLCYNRVHIRRVFWCHMSYVEWTMMFVLKRSQGNYLCWDSHFFRIEGSCVGSELGWDHIT